MGERLRSIRTERGYTRTDLARMAERSPPTIAAIEDGGQAGVDTIEALAKALGVSPGWLAYGVGPMEPPSRRRARPAAAAN
jgi:transcriptional regulator with XRE-family HTH domain